MPRKPFRKTLILGATLIALAACQGAPAPPSRFADLRFTGEAPIRLAVSDIQIVQGYQPVLQPPHMEERFPVPLARAARNWAHDRLRAAGSTGMAIVTITDASATATALPKQHGVSAEFTQQADTRYDARVAITVEIRDERGYPVRMANASAERSHTTLEDATLDQRDHALYQMESELMADLDRRLESAIRDGFNSYVQ